MIKKMISVLAAIIMIMGISIPTQASYISSTDSIIYTMYGNCLDRMPTTSEYNSISNQLSSGQLTGRQLAYNFFFSDEFIDNASRISNDELINIYYRVFLGRTADNQGLTYWNNQIANTNNDISILFDGFSNSTEFNRICTSYGINPGEAIEAPTTNRISRIYMSTYNSSTGEVAESYIEY